MSTVSLGTMFSDHKTEGYLIKSSNLKSGTQKVDT